ncbi:hypothetical protein MUY14_27860 [Amycolatopsis sp. FBCC-B4732]|uniref:hypothetical protein n=1 Tax=Amycolatopsis sp. FBCC-B4732 TaxID=3079339 RepID=UPI001FF0FC53|nr:hypothetical protein [Amycolatopsis sp. FBCC-B4732]UOX85591.1 hypothetical protein MUY14_27860 [Amycolatopsis sp. FBCC-B4732]
MTFFGIEGYEPRWLSGRGAITAAHGARLAALAGRRLSHAWLAWDLDDDSWFADCPVLLDFSGEQVELCHWKFDELSITWNTIRPAATPTWTDGGEPPFRLAWRDDARAGPAGLRGRDLASVELLAWAGADLAHGMVAPRFVFAGGDSVAVSNGLDENALEFGAPDPAYRAHPL